MRPKPIAAFLALVAVFLCLSLVPANSAACAKREKYIAHLSKNYKESQKIIGLVGRNTLMEFYVSEQGTWSMLMTGVDGFACLIAAGDNWEDVKPPKLSEPENPS